MAPRDIRTALATRPTAARPERPRLGTVIRRVSLSLLIACVIPAALFYVCVVAGGVWVAIFAALALLVLFTKLTSPSLRAVLFVGAFGLAAYSCFRAAARLASGARIR